ncbi:iron complex transport system ATP-binding protein [Ruminiclostridium sufflavum DSM 19573]|uniref:Iron complex transport system ATP-binding protein n=1 Tax=Ruminiclostridium sufflavum DSM 19573 TaxID=1121337 RepID=A0A318XFQ1_9FIRM|nr:ABC transporter ATP-binding protein [Ruminiclostridium sufflavum]PYG84343.1 iron complex transport system ATP-binding protein [Ruminiclostridium sufflavum DSM 19573]
MIKVKDICFSYDSVNRVILNNVGFDLDAGECLAILGNNGVGKSTLLKCIDRIHRIHSGSVIINGKDMHTLSRREMAQSIAYVPQNTASSHIMVFDAVLLGRKPYIRWDVGEEDKQIVSQIIERFGLLGYKARYLDELSGGELQKVVLARAMAQQPVFLLLDEPTSNLDPRNQHEMLNNVRTLAKEHGMGVAIVIHDLNLAVRYCDKFLFLKDGHAYSYGGIETVTPKAIEAVYNMKAEIIEHRDIKMIIPY